jgi:archaellum component FlaC
MDCNMLDDRLIKLNRNVAHLEWKRLEHSSKLSMLASRLAIIKDEALSQSLDEIAIVEEQIAEVEATLASIESHIHVYDRYLRAYLDLQLDG